MPEAKASIERASCRSASLPVVARTAASSRQARPRRITAGLARSAALPGRGGLQQSAVLTCLDLPQLWIAPPDTPRRLPRRLGLDPALAQLLREGLAPAVQVGLARVQALAVLRLGAHADVHVRVGLVVVQHHHVLVVGQLGLARTRAPPTARSAGRVPRGIDSMMLKASRRSLDVLDQAAAEAPVVGQFVQ